MTDTPRVPVLRRQVSATLFVPFVIGAGIMAIVVLAVATRAGYIPNFLNISFLNPPYEQAAAVYPSQEMGGFDKPVINIYPTKPTDVTVQFKNYNGLTAAYPDYRNGWSVTALPTGQLVDNFTGREYNYLFWEGKAIIPQSFDLATGFVVPRDSTSDFLQNKLRALGLTPKEYNEFIVYWMPRMIANNYNLVHFATQAEYADQVPLDITPKPDSILRVFIVFKGLNKPVSVRPQNFPGFIRNGFSVVEWGGTEVK